MTTTATTDILDLEPKRVWHWFNEICKIPHGSCNETRLADYLCDLAKGWGLEYKKDKVGNVIIRKPATMKTKATPIILQGHIDMVCVAADGVKYDPKTDPIKPYVDWDFVKAKGTSLGADNGIAVAMSLAVLEAKDLKHGPIECLFTVCEESDMSGINNLGDDMVTGRTMLNMDSEDDDIFFISSASCFTQHLSIPVKREKIPAGFVGLEFSISGLLSGHSGIEIIKQRGNANKLSGRILAGIKRKYDLYLAEFNGGTRHNVIPAAATVKIAVNKNDFAAIGEMIKNYASEFKDELKTSDPEVKVSMTPTNVSEVMDRDSTDRVIWFSDSAPTGVAVMSHEIPGLVQTSTSNGIIKTDTDKCTFTFTSRSALDSETRAITNRIYSLGKLAGASIEEINVAAAWQPNLRSKILNVMKRCYSTLFREEVKIEAMHAGLECGGMASRYKGIEIVSFGAFVRENHSPNERLNIKSTQKIWRLLLNILEEFAKS